MATEIMRRSPSQRKDFADQLLLLVADPRNLHFAWRHLARKNSQGAGPDGRNFADFTRAEMWSEIQRLSKELMTGAYQHGPYRRAKIEKHPGSLVTRDIWIANVVDRVVARAVAQILEPILGAYLPDSTFCWRGRGRELALATAITQMERLKSETWVTQDLRNAFPSVPRRRLLDVVQKVVGNDQVVGLIGMIIEGGPSQGIPAGSPVASLLLTFYIDYFIARPWRASHSDAMLLTYLDDFLLLPLADSNLRSVEVDFTRITNSAGFRLKYDWATAVSDIRYRPAIWLGYEVSKKDSKTSVRIQSLKNSAAISDHYSKSFLMLHNHPDAALLAPRAISQIISQAGPAYPHMDVLGTIEAAKAVAAAAGFDDLPSASYFDQQWKRHYDRWCLKLETISTPPLQPPDDESLPFKPVVVHTDGCWLRRSGGVGGWACIVERPGKQELRRRGGLQKTTNNRAELIAAIRALEAVEEPSRVTLVTDSKYLSEGIAALHQRRDQGWRCGSSQGYHALKNLDLWRQLYHLCARHRVQVKWVRGHTGDARNEWCDRQARLAAQALLRRFD